MGRNLITAWKWFTFAFDFRSGDSRRLKARAMRVYNINHEHVSTDTSFAGEFAAVSRALVKLKVDKGYVLDIGASDGLTMSCSYPLFRNGWSGAAIEMDPTKFATLASVLEGFPDISLIRGKVTPDNVTLILRLLEVPQAFDFLNVDIDSYDFYIVQSILESHFRPRVISMEINEQIPPPLLFMVLYTPDHVYQGDGFFGCSLAAATMLLEKFGYGLLELSYNNAIFIDLSAVSPGVVTFSATEAYQVGYAEQADRKQLFPWNAVVEDALALPAIQAEDFFRNHFRDYEGKFFLGIN